MVDRYPTCADGPPAGSGPTRRGRRRSGRSLLPGLLRRTRRPGGRLGSCFGILCVAICAWSIAPDGTAAAQADDQLVVAAYESEPFVVRSGDVPQGIMFDVWEQIAVELGWSYDVVWVETLDELAATVETDDVDVAVAPLSSTSEREERFDFTSAVVASGPVFGVHERTENPITLAGALFSRDILRLLMWSVLGLLILGHLMWWVDRRSPHSDMSPGYLRGVWDGTWWATVTVTTVGYGDTSPKTTGGRVVAMLAMLGGLFLVGAFVSEVTSALQSGRATTVVADVGDLGDRPVAVVEGSSYAGYLDDRNVETVGYDTQADAFQAAADGDLDIAVADKFTLEAVGSNYGLRSTDDPLYSEFIAFGIVEDSPLQNDINAVLSDLHQQGVVHEIVERWTD